MTAPEVTITALTAIVTATLGFLAKAWVPRRAASAPALTAEGLEEREQIKFRTQMMNAVTTLCETVEESYKRHHEEIAGATAAMQSAARGLDAVSARLDRHREEVAPAIQASLATYPIVLKLAKQAARGRRAIPRRRR